MSKIICDICGTSYPETAKQCPICGCVRPGDVQRVTNEVKSDGKVSTGYTYVKGGRFSKSNVKKRSKDTPTTAAQKSRTPRNEDENQNGSNKGLVITAIVLLLAIIGVVTYIALRFFAPISAPDNNNTTNNQQNNADLSCTDLILDTDTVVLEQVGEARLLYVSAVPENTTDFISFSSADESIATVSSVGKVTAVGEGTTTITITCGKVTKECTIVCQFTEDSSSSETTDETEDSSTDETEESTTDTSEKPEETIRLNRKDITFSYKGESWVLYSGDVAKNLISWSSDNESVATFVDGKVVAVGGGMTEVHAEYDGQKVSCIIRCSFKESSGVGGSGGVSEDGGGSGGNGGVSEDGGNSSSSNDSATYAIYTEYGNKTEDFSLKVGESVKLYLKDSNGNVVDATWQVTNGGISISGSTVKGVSKVSFAKVVATYNGKAYECIVRVN